MADPPSKSGNNPFAKLAALRGSLPLGDPKGPAAQSLSLIHI